MQRSAPGQQTESLGRAIGSRGRAREPNHDIALLAWIDVQVGIADVEDRLGIAELEIQASGAYLYVRHGWTRRTLDERLNVPARGFGLYKVEAGGTRRHKAPIP